MIRLCYNKHFKITEWSHNQICETSSCICRTGIDDRYRARAREEFEDEEIQEEEYKRICKSLNCGAGMDLQHLIYRYYLFLYHSYRGYFEGNHIYWFRWRCQSKTTLNFIYHIFSYGDVRFS